MTELHRSMMVMAQRTPEEAAAVAFMAVKPEDRQKLIDRINRVIKPTGSTLHLDVK